MKEVHLLSSKQHFIFSVLASCAERIDMPRAAKMPKDSSCSLDRIFQNRVNGIFKKASALHQIDNQARIVIFIEKPGVAPYVFTSDEEGFDWPCGAAEYVSLPSLNF